MILGLLDRRSDVPHKPVVRLSIGDRDRHVVMVALESDSDMCGSGNRLVIPL